MTQKLFYEDSFLSEFCATVSDCKKTEDGFEIILDKTAFFPNAGGQTCDKGTLNGICVKDVFLRDDCIIHLTEKTIETGTAVNGKIDFADRFKKMQNHTGEHLISGASHKLFGTDNFGFHLSDGYFTCDIDKVFTLSEIERIEDTVNLWISENHKVETKIYEFSEDIDFDYRSKNEFLGNIRIVDIVGCDKCACCAPHVNYTGQVGIAKIIDFAKHKQGTRITAVCGFSALADYRMLHEQNKNISNLLSAKRDETFGAACRQKEEIDSLDAEKKSLFEYIAKCELQNAENCKTNVAVIELPADAKLINAALSQISGNGAVICGVSGEYSFAATGDEDYIQKLKNIIGDCPFASGGGKANVIRGRINADIDTAKELLFINKH